MIKSDTYNSQTLILTPRVGNICNKEVWNLSQSMQKYHF